MSIETIPAIFHPTTVLLIDDNPDYLMTVQMVLRKDTAIYKPFDNPSRALDYVRNDYKVDPFVHRIVAPRKEDAFGHHGLDVDLSVIRNEVYNPKRFEQISVIVVDQEMPGLKGLELCEALKGNPIKKLMLTGEVNDRQALDAFNAGLIDHFINKADPDFADKLNVAIKMLQQEYFNNLSLIILDSIKHAPNQTIPHCLSDSLFGQFFNEFCESHHVCEFYLCDAHGSFMLFNNKGVASCLVVQNKEDINATFAAADKVEESPSEHTMEAIESGALLLFMPTEADAKCAPKDWQSQGLLHPGKSVTGEMHTYYYAYVENMDTLLQGKKILSLNEYVK